MFSCVHFRSRIIIWNVLKTWRALQKMPKGYTSYASYKYARVPLESIHWRLICYRMTNWDKVFCRCFIKTWKQHKGAWFAAYSPEKVNNCTIEYIVDLNGGEAWVYHAINEESASFFSHSERLIILIDMLQDDAYISLKFIYYNIISSLFLLSESILTVCVFGYFFYLFLRV